MMLVMAPMFGGDWCSLALPISPYAVEGGGGGGRGAIRPAAAVRGYP